MVQFDFWLVLNFIRVQSFRKIGSIEMDKKKLSQNLKQNTRLKLKLNNRKMYVPTIILFYFRQNPRQSSFIIILQQHEW